MQFYFLSEFYAPPGLASYVRGWLEYRKGYTGCTIDDLDPTVQNEVRVIQNECQT